MPKVTRMTTLDEIEAAAADLSPWAHLATVGADGKPDVAPVHPAWEGDTLCVMSFLGSVVVPQPAAQPERGPALAGDRGGSSPSNRSARCSCRPTA